MNKKAFSFIELLIVISIISILIYTTPPFFKNFILNYKLKVAAKELFFDFQHTKAQAVKLNDVCSILFDVKKNTYTINKLSKVVDLNEQSVFYGYGEAKKPITSSKKFPIDSVSYFKNEAVFTSYGMAKNLGYVYLSNKIGTTYVVGTSSINGIIIIKKWNTKSAVWE